MHSEIKGFRLAASGASAEPEAGYGALYMRRKAKKRKKS